jgi:hypothetical protein
MVTTTANQWAGACVCSPESHRGLLPANRELAANPGGQISATVARLSTGCHSGGEARVAVVQTTDFWALDDLAHTGWVDGSRIRRILAKRKMRSRPVVIGKVSLQDPMEVLLAEDNHVVKAFSADGAHETFSIWILPRRARCRENFLYAEATNSTAELLSVDAVAVTNHVLGYSVLRKCLDDLLGGPDRAGMFGHVEVKNTPPVMRQYEEDVKDAEGGRRHGEEVDRGQRSDVVVEEGSPRLRRRFSRSRRHEARDLSLGDHDAEFEKLAVNSRCAPALVGCSHALDQVTHLATDGRTAEPTVARPPRPESTKGPSVPAHDGLGFHNDQDFPPAGPEPGEGDPEEPVRMGQAKVRASMLEDRELLSQSKVLEDEIASAAECRSKGAEEAEEDGSHHVKMLQVGRRG